MIKNPVTADIFISPASVLIWGFGRRSQPYLGVAVVMLFEVIELLIDLTFAFVCGSSDGKVGDKSRKSFGSPLVISEALSLQAKSWKTGPMDRANKTRS